MADVRRFLFPQLKDDSPEPAGELQTPDGGMVKTPCPCSHGYAL